MGFEEKSGRLWQCIGERQDRLPGSGLIYRFQLFPKLLDDLGSQYPVLLQEMWPAVEPIVAGIDREVINSLPDDFDLIEHEAQYPPLLAFLGYGNVSNPANPEHEIFELPDLQTLQVRWACLHQRYPKLRLLDIVSSDGVVDDMGFVEAFLAHDALLSSGKEFVHDHFFHMLVLIKSLWDTCQKEVGYDAIKQPHIDRVKSAHALLRAYESNAKGLKDKVVSDGLAITGKEFTLMKTSLGLVADVLSASDAEVLNEWSVCHTMPD